MHTLRWNIAWDEGKIKDPRVTHNSGPCGCHCDHPASYNEAQLVSSCPICTLLFHGESPPLESPLVLVTFNGEFIPTFPEGSSIYIPEMELNYIQIGMNNFNRVPRTSGSARSQACDVLRGCSSEDTTMIAPSAFSYGGSEQKYGHRRFKM